MAGARTATAKKHCITLYLLDGRNSPMLETKEVEMRLSAACCGHYLLHEDAFGVSWEPDVLNRRPGLRRGCLLNFLLSSLKRGRH